MLFVLGVACVCLFMASSFCAGWFLDPSGFLTLAVNVPLSVIRHTQKAEQNAEHGIADHIVQRHKQSGDITSQVNPEIGAFERVACCPWERTRGVEERKRRMTT
jgi:hypothetical protein